MTRDFMFATGIENSYPTIHGGRVRVDEMEKCGHYDRWRDDFDCVDELGVTDCGSCARGNATYHPSCHGLRGLGIERQPRALLEATPLTLTPLAEAETCCGFGGLFAVKNVSA